MILVICGPTGVGKTKLSIELAKRYNAIIINADATQVYRGLDIGSAKISLKEMDGVKHYLIDIVSPDEIYTVYDYQKDFRKLIEDNKDKNIIVVGGSNLYIMAGLYDYEFAKRKDLDLSKYTNKELYEKVKQIDPNTKIHINNRVRLENFLQTEKINSTEPSLLYNAEFIGLTTKRDVLYEKINNRVQQMIKDGLVDEVKALYQKYPNSRILHSAIGYKEIIAYLNKEITLEEAIDLIKKNSRHYAKRQYTWMNNKMNITWFETNYEDFNQTIESVDSYIKRKEN